MIERHGWRLASRTTNTRLRLLALATTVSTLVPSLAAAQDSDDPIRFASGPSAEHPVTNDRVVHAPSPPIRETALQWVEEIVQISSRTQDQERRLFLELRGRTTLRVEIEEARDFIYCNVLSARTPWRSHGSIAISGILCAARNVNYAIGAFREHGRLVVRVLIDGVHGHSWQAEVESQNIALPVRELLDVPVGNRPWVE